MSDEEAYAEFVLEGGFAFPCEGGANHDSTLIEFVIPRNGLHAVIGRAWCFYREGLHQDPHYNEVFYQYFRDTEARYQQAMRHWVHVNQRWRDGIRGMLSSRT